MEEEIRDDQIDNVGEKVLRELNKRYVIIEKQEFSSLLGTINAIKDKLGREQKSFAKITKKYLPKVSL